MLYGQSHLASLDPPSVGFADTFPRKGGRGFAPHFGENEVDLISLFS